MSSSRNVDSGPALFPYAFQIADVHDGRSSIMPDYTASEITVSAPVRTLTTTTTHSSISTASSSSSSSSSLSPSCCASSITSVCLSTFFCGHRTRRLHMRHHHHRMGVLGIPLTAKSLFLALGLIFLALYYVYCVRLNTQFYEFLDGRHRRPPFGPGHRGWPGPNGPPFPQYPMQEAQQQPPSPTSTSLETTTVVDG